MYDTTTYSMTLLAKTQMGYWLKVASSYTTTRTRLISTLIN